MERIPLWLAVDADGNRAVSLESATEARDALIEDHDSAVIRTVQVSIHMDLPEVHEVDVTVPKEAEAVEAEAEETETEKALEAA